LVYVNIKEKFIMKLRDKFWLWGHPEGRYNNNRGKFGNFAESRMTPMEACLYLDVKNTFVTPVRIPVNKRQYNKSFTTLLNVGWDMCSDAVKNSGDISVVDEYLENAKDWEMAHPEAFANTSQGPKQSTALKISPQE
jgi:hypothetical protein